MAWDDNKDPEDLIRSSEWNNMVTDQKDHALRHKDGGIDELDAAELAGDLGTSGQVLQTDGGAASWQTIQTGSSVSNNGTEVEGSPDDINFGQGVEASSDGDGSASVVQNVVEGGGKVFVQDTEPSATQVGDVWIASGGDVQ